MGDNGSGPARGGSKIKASTDASRRRASVPEMAQTYRYPSGGSVTIPATRRAEANSKNEKKKLAKELWTARKLAREGNRVDFSPHGEGTYDILFNGRPADLKRVASAGQIVKHGKKAIRKQGANAVIFDFTEFGSDHIKELQKLANRYGIHGRYFTPIDEKSRAF